MFRKALMAAALLALPLGGMAASEPACAAGGCCKTCKKGKPCGDSCIARDKPCTKGQGCACAG